MKDLVIIVTFLAHFEFYYSITTIESLKLLQSNISKNYSTEGAAAWGLNADGTYSYCLLKKSFLYNSFHNYVADEPIFVYEAATHTDSALGNRFGNYFEALACADAAGLHFVGVSEQSDVNLFSKAFPTIRLQDNPVKDRKEAESNVKRLCTDEKFPWSSSSSLFYKNYYLVHDVMQNAVDTYLNNAYLEGVDSKVPSDTFSIIRYPKNTTEDKKNAPLPLVPTAAILFRCSDILIQAKASSGSYGFTKWNVIIEKIPANSIFIYILTEPINYMNSGGQLQHCTQLLEYLVEFLSKHFPNSLIAVRRGHPNDGLVALSKASVVVCTASTFCIFPAFANSDGKIYLQQSNLFGDHKEVRFAPNIRWIPFSDQMYFSEFNHRDARFVEHAVNCLISGSTNQY